MSTVRRLASISWRRSSRGGSGNGDHAAVAATLRPYVPVRDSRGPHGSVLAFGDAGWTVLWMR